MTDGPVARGFEVRPRTIVIAMVAIAVVAAIVLALSLMDFTRPGSIEFAELAEGQTVGLAGVFPPEGEPPLANPLGIVWDGERLYVAESDAGIVRVYDERGGVIGAITIPVAEGVPSAYPAVLAVAGDRLAVVDNAAMRVVVMSADPAAETDAGDLEAASGASAPAVLFALGEEGDPPRQPTAVTVYGDEYFVADAADSDIKVYDAGGRFVRSIAGDLSPRLTYVGGMVVDDRGLCVVDSNAGRVLIIDPDTGDEVLECQERFTLPRAIVSLGEGAAVVDAFARSVSIIDADGALAESIDAGTVPEGSMASPRGVAWVPDPGRLYVTDTASGVVVVFNVQPR